MCCTDGEVVHCGAVLAMPPPRTAWVRLEARHLCRYPIAYYSVGVLGSYLGEANQASSRDTSNEGYGWWLERSLYCCEL